MNNRFCASARGFTLVEMMTVIVLMTVLLAMALPNFSSLIEKYRVQGMASALMASLSHARSEAARRGKTVTLQQRAECRGRDWSCGWDTTVGSGDTVETLRRQDPDTRVAIGKSSLGAVSFDAMGHSAGLASFSFSFRPAGNDASSNAAAVCVALGGRDRLVKGSATC